MIRRRSRGAAVAVAVAIVLAGATVDADVVVLRGGADPLDGTVVEVTDAGVSVETEPGAIRLVRWDRVRSVDATNPDHARAVAERLEFAETLWRARSRLQRGDAALAEPLFARAFERIRGRTDETALIAAEGLLRCRLAQADQAAAVVPALETMRLRRAQVTTDVYAHLPPLFDEETGLCRFLPPVWLARPTLRASFSDVSAYETDDPVVTAVANAYRVSLARALGLPPSEEPPDVDDPGVDFLRLLLRGEDAEESVRNSARRTLLRGVEERAPFARAWSRFVVGRSLLREPDRLRRQRGVIQLLHVPVRHGRLQPYLAGLALELVGSSPADVVPPASSSAIRAELASRFPYHPVRALPDAASAPPPHAAPSDPEDPE